MSTMVPVDVPSPDTPNARDEEPKHPPLPHFSKRRLAAAFTTAALSDGISFYLTPMPPLQWAADGVTALLLFMVLGWQWILLPGLVMEAVPGFNVFPFWVLVVGAVAMWGTARPNLKSIVPSGKVEAS